MSARFTDVSAEPREFSARRERLALRARVQTLRDQSPSAEVAAFVAPRGEYSDVELGNFAALQSGTTLWVSATPLTQGQTRVSVHAAALAWLAARTTSSSGLVDRLAVVDSIRPDVTARILSATTLDTLVVDATTSESKAAAPAPHLAMVSPSSEHLSFAGMFRDAGADVVIEHGVVAGEVIGLEVARVVQENGQACVQIGVGVHDRETFRMLNGAVATLEQMREVVRVVATHRAVGAPKHPLNLLATERALRHRTLLKPERIGCRSLEVVEPPYPRANLKDAVPCCATGIDLEGRDCVVVFTSGVDLDAIPFAVDARSRLSSHARLLVVAEARNIIPLQSKIASLFRVPIEMVSA